MKKLRFLVIAAILLSGCAGSNKAQEKAVLDSIINVHEKVMTGDEQLMKNKMLLDTLLKNNPWLNVGVPITDDIVYINLADSAMDTWMHNFQPDQTGKPHEEVMSYMKKQKRQIMSVDSQITSVLKATNDDIKRFNKEGK
jgi:hypothetical protein